MPAAKMPIRAVKRYVLRHRVNVHPQDDRQSVNVETCGSELLASALDDFGRGWFDIL
jgi:hypothetical protein